MHAYKILVKNLMEKSCNFGELLEDGRVTVDMNIIKFSSNFCDWIELFCTRPCWRARV